MRTNATLLSITRAGVTTPCSIRCHFSGSSLTDQGGTAEKPKGTLLVPHHELVRNEPAPPHGYPKVGDTVVIRLDTRMVNEFGDDITYVVETARGHPGGAMKHWHYTLK